MLGMLGISFSVVMLTLVVLAVMKLHENNTGGTLMLMLMLVAQSLILAFLPVVANMAHAYLLRWSER